VGIMELKDIYNMMHYFHFEKYDVERWVGFEEAIEILKEKDPEFIRKYYQMKDNIELFNIYLNKKYDENPID
jgi:hypothetical protein